MKNESADEMWAELKASKPKLFFMIFLVVVGGYAFIVDGVSIPGIGPERIPHSYDDIMKEVYLSKLTSAQKEAKKSEFKGKTVSWQATVIDVQPGRRGNTVQLTDGDKRMLTDYYLEGVSDGDSMHLRQDDVIRFSGKIDRIVDGMMTGYVYLKDAKIE